MTTAVKDCDVVRKVDVEIYSDVCMTETANLGMETADLEMLRRNVIAVCPVMRNVLATDCNTEKLYQHLNAADSTSYEHI